MDENGTDPHQDGSEPALRELAARLLAPPPYRGEDREAALPTLYVGRLPEDLPVDLPMPAGATVVGSSVRDLPRGRRAAEVVLDSTMPAEGLREDYRRRLLAAGWRDHDRFPGRNGFTPAVSPASSTSPRPAPLA